MPLFQGRVKVREEAALPPDLRKASGFPATLPPPSSARLEGSAFQPSGGDWLGHMPRGKAKPFRKSGGRAAVGCYPSRTLKRPWPLLLTPCGVSCGCDNFKRIAVQVRTV
jgi:hypothetical protein